MRFNIDEVIQCAKLESRSIVAAKGIVWKKINFEKFFAIISLTLGCTTLVFPFNAKRGSKMTRIDFNGISSTNYIKSVFKQTFFKISVFY